MFKLKINEEYLETLKKQYKYDINISNFLENKSTSSKKNFEVFKYINKHKKPLLPDSLINLFYDSPKKFFALFNQLSLNHSLFDTTGNSIFAHYFDALYIRNENNIEIYENNFVTFFQENGHYLSLQDEVGETPLHKLVKFKGKKFFFEICEKLFNIKVLNETIISIKNNNKQSCYDIVVDEILRNKKHILEKNEFDLYYNFFKYFPDVKNSMSIEKRRSLIFFENRIFIDVQNYQDINITETLNGFSNLLKNLNNKKEIFNYIYYPSCDINYINIIFNKCLSQEHFDLLFDLISYLSKIVINKINKNISYSCLAHHINYVIRHMEKTKTKGEMKIEYGLKLLKVILPLIIENNKSKTSENLIYGKNNTKYLYRQIQKSLLNNLMNNQFIYLDKKIDIYINFLKEFDIGTSFIDTIFTKSNNNYTLLKFFLDPKDIDCYNEENRFYYFKQIFYDFYFVGQIYLHIDKEYEEKLNEFFRKNYLDLFDDYKIRYNFSNERLKILLEVIIKYEKIFVEKIDEIDKDNKYKEEMKKKSPYEIWYSKFIITEKDLFCHFLYQSDLEQKLILTTLRLFLILYYNYEEIKDFPEAFTFFGEKVGKNYLINHEEKIKNLIQSLDKHNLKDFHEKIFQNFDSLILFYDEEKELDEEVETKKIKCNIIILQRLTEKMKENPSVYFQFDLIEINNKRSYERKFYKKYCDNICRLLTGFKKLNTSLSNCVKDFHYSLLSFYYILLRNYNFLINDNNHNEKKTEQLDIIFEEINNILKINYKVINEKDRLRLGYTFNHIHHNYNEKKKQFISDINIIKQKILNDYNDIDISNIETYLRENIFMFFYFLPYFPLVWSNQEDGKEYDNYIFNFEIDPSIYTFFSIIF